MTSSFSLIDEDDVSVILGSCPTCHANNRSLVVTQFFKNVSHPPKSKVHFKCLCCLNEYTTQALYITQR